MWLWGNKLVHLNWRQWVFLMIFLFDRRPPAELKEASELGVQNSVGTLYEIISILNAIFYVIMPKKHVQMTNWHESIVSQVSQIL